MLDVRSPGTRVHPTICSSVCQHRRHRTSHFAPPAAIRARPKYRTYARVLMVSLSPPGLNRSAATAAPAGSTRRTGVLLLLHAYIHSPRSMVTFQLARGLRSASLLPPSGPYASAGARSVLQLYSLVAAFRSRLRTPDRAFSSDSASSLSLQSSAQLCLEHSCNASKCL
ncbi:hypothetical protein OH77DRAFT_400243 [Trametes cingulata]|nr:hypothetical protein OH77DRAFT_400243 [Trametes cingulata]